MGLPDPHFHNLRHTGNTMAAGMGKLLLQARRNSQGRRGSGHGTAIGHATGTRLVKIS